MTLSQSASMKFYSDSECSSEISSATISSGDESVSLWVNNALNESVTLSATDDSSSLSSDFAITDFVSDLAGMIQIEKTYCNSNI